jgi:predicted RND superfamily exporter protein
LAAFVYLNARDIGLTIDTLPVISLGIGLGVDYGIYTAARIGDEVRRGASTTDAVATTLRNTGGAVLSTFAVMAAAILPWLFSPVLFHHQMAVLVIVLMASNTTIGVSLLSSYINWRAPIFITR